VLYDMTGLAADRRLAWRLGLRLLARGIERLRALTDYTQYGGSPILGFEHLVIKCHGRSNARAIGNAVKVAAKAVRDHVPREIADALAAAR
jgi:glycerol-3-phosphate acyltransferase PlsX